MGASPGAAVVIVVTGVVLSVGSLLGTSARPEPVERTDPVAPLLEAAAGAVAVERVRAGPADPFLGVAE
ncbi:hypothetical protein FHT40_003893 [Mycolicibacterium sp. BK556]|uniref:hypothetical protein n=1 Tax=unclassified Mycolicibacterium TaxID=2636767 RepID=UPI001621EA2C|nr:MULTISPECIES: hypothetical protein [unclassified Mycolicibacterium]MBB3604215.1 hypothetical protein [Mycolicibacterium sp. BK556]MBB3635072.1 hypothetical protein [Mycolicibacterium sp. BK607]